MGILKGMRKIQKPTEEDISSKMFSEDSN